MMEVFDSVYYAEHVGMPTTEHVELEFNPMADAA